MIGARNRPLPVHVKDPAPIEGDYGPLRAMLAVCVRVMVPRQYMIVPKPLCYAPQRHHFFFLVPPSAPRYRHRAGQ